MQDCIRLLPDSIANQIAAGEVVQRPSSVVKELMENAIDAQCSEITLIVKDAGKTFIQVLDDGIGMSETDARMSFERHATSKIRKAEDLFTILTMGFRGEALASIAAVAQVEMRTKTKDSELGTSVIIEGSEVKNQTSVACQDGTSIVVKNLFFNVPARRNFLKSNPVELRHIMEEFQRIALANAGMAFNFFQNELEVYQLRPGKLSKRIVSLFGKNYQEQLVPCEEDMDGIFISGYVGKPEFSRKSRGEQFIYVNNRYIRSSYLNHAVVTAYSGLIPEGNHPFYVLFLKIDPKHIDVNVHPTKTEIKFDDERSVYTLVKLAVRKALGSHHITPSLDFSIDTNFKINTSRTGDDQQQSDRGYSQFSNIPEINKKRAQDWEKLFEDALNTETLRAETLRQNPGLDIDATMRMDSAVNSVDRTDNIGKEYQSARQIFQINQGYIAARVKSGLMLIDQKAAHERILFEKYSEILRNKKGSSQQSLFPEQITMNPADFALVKELESELKNIGFSFEEFGDNTLAVSGVPVDAPNQSVEKVFTAILDDFKKHQQEYRNKKSEYMARAFARYSSIDSERKLAFEEMASLIDQLFACDNPNHNPDGQLIYYILKVNDIHQIFNKRTNVR